MDTSYLFLVTFRHAWYQSKLVNSVCASNTAFCFSGFNAILNPISVVVLIHMYTHGSILSMASSIVSRASRVYFRNQYTGMALCIQAIHTHIYTHYKYNYISTYQL